MEKSTTRSSVINLDGRCFKWREKSSFFRSRIHVCFFASCRICTCGLLQENNAQTPQRLRVKHSKPIFKVNAGFLEKNEVTNNVLPSEKKDAKRCYPTLQDCSKKQHFFTKREGQKRITTEKRKSERRCLLLYRRVEGKRKKPSQSSPREERLVLHGTF